MSYIKLPVTMRKVAERAGVSTATVSRALSHPEKLSLSTRLRVEEAVISCRYSVQSGPVCNEAKIILLLVAGCDRLAYSEIIEEIKQTVSEHNYILSVSYDNSQRAANEPTPHYSALSRQLGGVIQIGTITNSTWLQQHGIDQLPKIMIGCTDYSPNAVNIDVDHLTCAFTAVNYLCRLGYSRIAYIAGNIQNDVSNYHRQGYEQALRRKKIALEKNYIVHGEISFGHGQRALEQLMSLPVPPNAIYCRHDIIAIGAIHQAKRLGIDIPRQLSVVGMGNTEMSRYYDPPVTTVSYPANLVGKQAVTTLLNWLQRPEKKPTSYLTESEIIERKTTIKRQNE